ncbi:MAG: radical SAM protein [Magnetococcales bacterium]|nr:radical SAM protein [Magnetococcales bacterium]
MTPQIPEFPHVVRIEPASACNLACRHCPTGTVDMERGIMKPPVIERVMAELEQVKNHVRVVVLYHGGEPFMNKRFLTLLAAVKQMGIAHVKTVSNGMLLKDHWIDGIIDGGLDAIEFSLDGTSAAMNDFIRRKSDFETVVANIKRLIDRCIEKGAQAPTVAISQAQFIDPNAFDGQPCQPAAYIQEAFSGHYADHVTFKTTWAMQWPEMMLDRSLFGLFRDESVSDSAYCDQAINTMTITADGKVVGCCYDLTHRLILGDVMSERLPEIWQGKRAIALRESIARKRYISICQDCNTVRAPVYLVYKSKKGAIDNV